MSGLRPIFYAYQPEPETSGSESSYKVEYSGSDRDPARPFDELVGEGLLRRQWLEYADEPNCPIEQSTLTYEDLMAVLPNIEYANADSRIKREVADMEGHASAIPDDLRTLIQNTPPGTSHRIILSNYDESGLIWTGLIGPGVMMIDLFDRKENSAALHVSEVSQAVYQNYHPLQFLRYIFILGVINKQTISCIKDDLYGANGDDNLPAGWPSGSGLQEWNHGTPQFDALMGTRIGKTVASILLSAFPRGTRRIGKIATWPCASSANIRFDLDVFVPADN
ncbi:hypothetical protein N7481_005465 [Penicillium waksmanii]|uniref:uncharacterized protein n=1 Tax=Penicillium waksmanii TaxID=69791 RepID=UPI00254976D6|nr:uncharacterized protein N7481_005465 [Penicillium waksmanii]KAJ5983366.1 hypothetical protein N7481_005465 [Penicillium waksmanii]